ncbi:MAG TPA: glycine cleavage system aminomethyltransferase GcvT [Stellaceae bacterium]|nr:glycine cleavage system aminomethyltransferase GcvT [Stellaceae bacterium]
MSAADPSPALLRVPLHDLHRDLGAKFVPFAGYEMPVQYAGGGSMPSGVLAEHLHTRTKAGLFDVSHMGQLRLVGSRAAAALETLVPGEIQALKPFRMRYTLLTNPAGGILDDLMVTNAGDHLMLVVNAATKSADIAYLIDRLPADVRVEPLPERALLALQGPEAVAVMARLAPELASLGFMTAGWVTLVGVQCFVTRSGYTGEDGFEISVPAEAAAALGKRLLAEPEVAPIGLGARDSLRLEAGLCLYGHDIDETTTVIEADLAWAVGKRRRVEGGFPGADIIWEQLANGAPRKRVGILPEGRAPAREHTPIVAASGATPIGEVTSGGFGPSAGAPIAMGYVDTAHAALGTELALVVRDVPRPARIAALPFIAHRYHRAAT